MVGMRAGRIEQAGSPQQVFEHPANPFVMSFIGPMTAFNDAFVRPHDVDVRNEPTSSSYEAMVQRITHLGFEVRANLMLADGRHIWAQITRDDVEQLDLTQGQIVYVRPSREKRFAPVSRARMLFGNAG